MTIFEQFQKSVRRFPRKKAISFFKGPRVVSWSYQKFHDRVVALSIGLQELGLKKGDRLAILAPNGPEWALIDLATARAGIVLVPIHTTLSGEQIRLIIEKSQAKALALGSHGVLEGFFLLREILPGLTYSINLLLKQYLPSVKPIIILDEAEERLQMRERTFYLSELLEAGREELELKRKVKEPVVKADDLSTIVFTSGTTGEMKGVRLSHKNIVHNALANGKVIKANSRDVCLSILPLSHSFERTGGLLMSLFYGFNVVYGRGLAHIPDDIKVVKPTILAVVPRILEKLCVGMQNKIKEKSGVGAKVFELGLRRSHFYHEWKTEENPFAALVFLQDQLADRLFYKKIREEFGGRLVRICCGGASLDPKIGDFFRSIGIPILEGYGLTEASPTVAANPTKKVKIGSVGPPLPDVQVRISDNGEILVKGPNVMMGYEKDAKETRRTIDKNGWLHTGDQGYLDQDGYLYVTGRFKELIVTAYGKNVSPVTVENELTKSPFMEQVMVYGSGRPYLVALVVPVKSKLEDFARSQGLSSRDLHSLCRSHEVKEMIAEEIERRNRSLAQHERVKKFAIIPDEFTQHNNCLTPTLKLRRHIIEKRHLKKLTDLYSA